MEPNVRASRATPTITVIGAGLAGLLTSCYLAKAGATVVLVDAGPIGGRARSLLLGGVSVNPGPRALYRGLALHQALRELGIEPHGHAPGGGFGFADGQLHTLPSSPASLLSTSLLHGAARREAALILARITIGALGLEGEETIDAWIERHARTDEARALVAALARVATYCPVGFGGKLAGGAALANMRSAFSKGVLYVEGGWLALVDALLARARALGVVVLEHAAAVSVEGPDVTLADGRLLHADGLVVAGGPALAKRLLGPRLRTEPEPASRAVLAACLDLVLEALPQPSRRFVLGIDRPLYFSVHTAPSSLGPFVVHLARYGAGTDGTREELEAFADVVQPGWRDRLRAARYLPKMVVMHDVPTSSPGPHGSDRRQSGVVDERTVLAGDWLAGPGLLADAAASSAKLAAHALLSSLSSLSAVSSKPSQEPPSWTSNLTARI